jgi:hypothetical protein
MRWYYIIFIYAVNFGIRQMSFLEKVNFKIGSLFERCKERCNKHTNKKGE